MQQDAKSRAVFVEAYEFRKRGEFFAFAYGSRRCECGSLPMLLPLPLRISRHPFIDVAQSLSVAGWDQDAPIVMMRDGHVSLRSTIGKAAALRATESKTGTPVLRHQENGMQQPHGEAKRVAAIQGRAIQQNAPASPLLPLPVKRAA